MRTLSVLIFGLSLGVAFPTWGSVGPALSIAQQPNGDFYEEALIRGGKDEPAIFQKFSAEFRPREGSERWTLEFSDPAKKKFPKFAPTFQIKIVKAESFQRPDGTVVFTEPPKIILSLRAIQSSQWQLEKVKQLVKRSHFIREIIPYPPIEGGDQVIELVLSRETLVSAHQPRHAENQVILDLK